MLAPTGTIAFMMDCDTTGVEPDIALVKYKKLVGGGMMKIVNQTVPRALQAARLRRTDDRRDRRTTSTSTTRSKARRSCATSTCRCSTAPSRPRTATRSIHHMGHIKMMGAAQPFISGAISKTVNLPERGNDRRRRRRLPGGLAARREGDRHLPRRLQEGAAALDLEVGQAANSAAAAAERSADPPEDERHPQLASPTSSASRATTATSRWGSTTTGRPARSSCRWRSRARPSAA